jgi:hypothetical protein
MPLDDSAVQGGDSRMYEWGLAKRRGAFGDWVRVCSLRSEGTHDACVRKHAFFKVNK